MTARFSITSIAAPVLLAAALCPTGYAQRACPAGTSLVKATAVNSAAPMARQGALWAAAAPAAVVTGGGLATLTDTDKVKFTHQFSLSAVLNGDGSARGKATFVFSGDFSQKWGALPGVADVIDLKGDLKTGTVDSAGNVTLGGPFIETDYSRGDGIVYREDSTASGAPPLSLVVAADGKTFTLTWCAFIPDPGLFLVEVKTGKISVR